MVKIGRAFAAAEVAILALLVLIVALAAAPAHAGNIIDEWANVKAPSPPELKTATADPKTTALLLMDFVPHDPYCGPAKPRCAASLPAVKQLLAAARAAGATVIYSVAGNYGPSDIAPEIAPQGNEATVKSKSDKFLNTDLEKMLRDKGIQTVIVTGNSANGAVLYTGTEAALRGFKVIVPVDGLSAPDLLGEQVTVWQLANGPGFGALVTLTRSDMIKF